MLTKRCCAQISLTKLCLTAAALSNNFGWQLCVVIETKCIGLLTMHQTRALRYLQCKDKRLAVGFNAWEQCMVQVCKCSQYHRLTVLTILCSLSWAHWVLLSQKEAVDRAGINSVVSFVMAAADSSVGGEREVSVLSVRKLHNTPLKDFAEWCNHLSCCWRCLCWRYHCFNRYLLCTLFVSFINSYGQVGGHGCLPKDGQVEEICAPQIRIKFATV